MRVPPSRLRVLEAAMTGLTAAEVRGLRVLQAASPRARCQQVGVSEASFGQLLTVSAVCVLISSYQATPPVGLGPTPMTSFCLNYNFRGSAL